MFYSSTVSTPVSRPIMLKMGQVRAELGPQGIGIHGQAKNPNVPHLGPRTDNAHSAQFIECC